MNSTHDGKPMDDGTSKTVAAVLLYFEQAKRYTDDAFELAAEECKALREEVTLLREHIDRLEHLAQFVQALEAALKPQEVPPRVDGMRLAD